MKRAFFFAVMLVACRRSDAEHEKDDDKKREGARTTSPSRTLAEEALHAYEGASSCDARAQTIVHPAENRALLTMKPCFARKLERIDAKECDALGGNDTQCHAFARRDDDKKRYWLVKQPNGQFLVDFQATERPRSLGDYRIYQPKAPTVVRVRAGRTSVYYKPYRGQEAKYLVARLRPVSGDGDALVYAYVLRDSDDGKRMAALLNDNSDYEITLALGSPTNESPATAVVTKFFGNDFFETDAERDYVASLADGGA